MIGSPGGEIKMNDLVGRTLLDRYFLRESVGAGGMADVYLAWDMLRSSKMAVKVLRRDLASNPRFFQMFAKEAEYLRKLEHPNIVRLYEFEKDGDIAFIVMDWIDGSNLRQAIINHKKPFTIDEVRYILAPVCSALNYAHQNQVYHCDVKPQNILLHNDGRVLLTDFGVARLASDNIGGGTPPYMAPEQFLGNEVSAKSDIYSLGITLYEMLSGGNVPFRGDSASSQGSTTRERIAWEHMNLPLPPLRNQNERISQAIEAVVLTALNKNPGERYPSTMALRDAFEQASSDEGQDGSILRTIVSLIPPISEQSTPKVQKPRTSAASRPATIRPKPAQLPPKQEQSSQVPSTVQGFKRLIQSISVPKVNLPKVPHGPSSATSLQKQGIAAYLFGRSGDWVGRQIPIQQRGLSLGRSSQNQIQVSEASVSRTHATIIVSRRSVYIRDENSSLGTFVNGVRIAGPTKLKHGDIIQIGYYQIFEFRER